MPFKLAKLKSFQFLFAGVFLIVVVGGFSVLKKDNVEPVISQTENKDVVATEPQVVALSIDGSEITIGNSAAPEVQVAPVVEEPAVPVAAPNSMDLFSKCLTAKGATLFGAYWCPHCQSQKKAFGESVQYINYIECADEATKTQATVCQSAGIKGYPTWQFADGSEIVGQVSFEDLSAKTGCPFVE
ncbi:MAG: thioredoxin domain-containing protein [Candidatus Uhrbacteria bacterium]